MPGVKNYDQNCVKIMMITMHFNSRYILHAFKHPELFCDLLAFPKVMPA